VVPVAETWLTYRELAQALDISPEAARQKAIRGHWRRQRGNDGKARILVDVDAEKSVHTPRRRTDKHLNEHPDERRTFEALEAHIATLKEAVAKAEAVGERHRQEAEVASKRVDHLVAELVGMSMRMAEQTAVAEKVRTEFDAYRTRRWWRRIARSAA
jgi:chromosome segregation ATPase